MAKKKEEKKSQLEMLDERLQTLVSKKIQAYTAGANQNILDQFDRMIEEIELEIYTISELKKSNPDDDGEQWIV